MYTPLTSKVLLRTIVRFKRFSVFRVSSEPVKMYCFKRCTTTAASGVLTSDSAEEKKFIPQNCEEYNKYYREYLLQQPEYREFVLDFKNLNFETEGRPKSLQILQELNNNNNNDDDANTELLKKLKTSLLNEKESFDIDEICKSFFLKNKYRENPLTLEVLNDLEEELLRRKLSRSELLKGLFALKEVGRKRRFFQKKTILRLGSKLNTLTEHQLVVFLYSIIPMSLEQSKGINFNVGRSVRNNLPKLNAVEVGIVVNGLLFGRFNCRATVVTLDILERMLDFGVNLPEATVFFVSKLMQKSPTGHVRYLIWQFQEQFIPYVAEFNVNTLVSLLLLGRTNGNLSLNLWEAAASTIKENMNNYSILNISRIISVLSCFDIQDEEILKFGIGKFEEKIDELFTVTGGKECLVLLLENLIHLRVYPKKLFDVLFANGVENFKGEKNKILATYWYIKCCLDLDKPEFQYDSFTPQQKNKLTRLCFFIGNSSDEMKSINRLMKNLSGALKGVFGDDKVEFVRWHILHAVGGIIMRFDKDLNAQPIPESCRDKKYFRTGDGLRPSLKDDTFCVYFLFCESVYKSVTETISLRAQTEIRHLQKFGYYPIPVCSTDTLLQNRKSLETELVKNVIRKYLPEHCMNK